MWRVVHHLGLTTWSVCSSGKIDVFSKTQPASLGERLQTRINSSISTAIAVLIRTMLSTHGIFPFESRTLRSRSTCGRETGVVYCIWKGLWEKPHSYRRLSILLQKHPVCLKYSSAKFDAGESVLRRDVGPRGALKAAANHVVAASAPLPAQRYNPKQLQHTRDGRDASLNASSDYSGSEVQR